MTARRRPRRTRDDLRQLLLESSLEEFATKGFDGASTRSIARRVDAHQPQINYHFASKEALWVAAVDHLFALLVDAVDPILPDGVGDDPDVLGAAFAERIRRFVRFAAAHPELNRILVREAAEDSERLRWMVERHVRPLYELITAIWEDLRATGIAAHISTESVHYVLIGAASLPFVNAPEARMLTGHEPTDPAWVEQHADGIIATLLPGLPLAPPRRKPAATAGR